MRQPRFFTAGLLLLFYSIMLSGLGVLPLLRSQMKDYLGLGLGQYGLLLSFGMFPAALGALAGGFLTRSQRWAQYLLPVAVGLGIAFTGVAMTRQFGVLLCALGVTNFLLAVLSVLIPNALIHMFPQKLRRVTALFLVCPSFAGIGSSFLIEPALQWSQSSPGRFAMLWHALFGGLSLFSLVMACCIRKWVVLPENDSTSRISRSSGDSCPVTVRCGTAIAALAVGGMLLHGIADTGLSYWLPYHWEAQGIGTFWKPGYLIGMIAFAYVLSRSLLSLLPEQTLRRSLLILPGLLGGLTMFAALLVGGQNGALLYPVAGLLWSCEFPVFLAKLAEATPGRFGLIFSIQGVLSNLLGEAIYTGIGWAANHTAIPLGSWLRIFPAMFLGASLCGAVIVLLSGKRLSPTASHD